MQTWTAEYWIEFGWPVPADVKERQAVLGFDQMNIKKEYDARNKTVYGPHKKLQTVIVRNLFLNWKETIFLDINRAMTLDLIISIVVQCENKGVRINGVWLWKPNPPEASWIPIS